MMLNPFHHLCHKKGHGNGEKGVDITCMATSSRPRSQVVAFRARFSPWDCVIMAKPNTHHSFALSTTENLLPEIGNLVLQSLDALLWHELDPSA